MARKSNKATCKLETSLSEFCFIVQRIDVGTSNKRKNHQTSPRIKPVLFFQLKTTI